jgi:hypothetical protein
MPSTKFLERKMTIYLFYKPFYFCLPKPITSIMRTHSRNNWILSYAKIAFIMVFFLLISSALHAEVIWSTSHETGDLSDWCSKDQNYECVFNTGGSDARVTVTSEAAHTGDYAVKMEVWNIDKQERGCRIFRWAEYLTEGYFSCWLMFPTLPTVFDWLNIFQFKKTNGVANDPTWYNEVHNKSFGTVLTLTHWEEEWDIPSNGNPSPALAAGKWFHVEWYYKDGTADGELKIWINGQKVWDLRNEDTRGVDSDIQWAPSLYGENVSPGHLVLYLDDAVISEERVGPSYFKNGGSDSGGGGGGGGGG